MDQINVPVNIPVEYAADFGLIDFANDTKFEQFIDLIRGENSDPFVEICASYDCSAGCFGDSQFAVPTQENLFDFNVTDIDPNCALNLLPEENDGDQSRAPTPTTSITTTTTTTPSKKSTKADRSKTIVSERRRRGRMKEKLYALRALVPNITKMDKASIIGDAVQYMQELQMQAKKLKTEIAVIESSLTESNRYQQGSSQTVNKMNFTHNHQVVKKIMQIDVFQVEERGFYVRLVCNKGFGVAVSLYKTLESFSSFNVQSSNLATAAEGYILTFTLHVGERKVDMNYPNLKLWIARAFLNQGFDFETSVLA